jgi:hypothetical protein
MTFHGFPIRGNHLLVAILLLLFIIFCSGCLSSSTEESAVRVDILEKKPSSGELGECSYSTVMAVTNTGSSNIHSLSIIVEIYDPDARKVAAQESVPVGDLRPGEVKNITSTLQAHCRLNYTLRAYAQY